MSEFYDSTKKSTVRKVAALITHACTTAEEEGMSAEHLYVLFQYYAKQCMDTLERAVIEENSKGKESFDD